MKDKTVSYGGVFVPQQRKITGEKIYIVRDCAEGRISYTEAAARCGVAFETIRRWVSRYCAEGASAFLSPQHNRVYSPVLKEAAVKAYADCHLDGFIDCHRKPSVHNILESTKHPP